MVVRLDASASQESTRRYRGTLRGKYENEGVRLDATFKKEFPETSVLENLMFAAAAAKKGMPPELAFRSKA